MKFYMILASIFLCLYSCNNNVHCSDELINPVLNTLSDNYSATDIKDTNELTNDLANSEVSDKTLISKYSLNSVISTLKFEGNEDDTIEYYDNIAKTLMSNIAQVKQDYENSLISRQDAEILLNYFNSIMDNAKIEMEKAKKKFQNLDVYIKNLYSNYDDFYYNNRISN